MDNKIYCNINKRYLAEALSFLGFKYFKFQNEGKTVYSFEDNDKFRIALTKILELRKELNGI